VTYNFITDVKQAHLGGNINEGDPLTFSPCVWKYLIERFALKSVLDLGSGRGHAAWYFHKRGVPVIAVDGLTQNVHNAIYPTVLHDLSKGPFICNVDLVYCVETVEHIDPEHLEHLLSSLTCGDYIIISHAAPGQAGHHHVNCQDDTYWIENLKRVGAHYLEIDTVRIRGIAHKEGAAHLARSALVFTNLGKFIS